MSFFSNLAKQVSDPEFIKKVEDIGNQLIDTHIEDKNASKDVTPAPAPQSWNHTNHQNSNSNKKALFIGINYFGTEAELRGCIKDVENLSRFVRDQCGFPESNIRRLTDDKQNKKERPTRANILANMRWLVENARPGDSLFLHYSGHGSQQEDEDGDEADGIDETICPEDYDTAGMITDDEMHSVMCASLPAGVKFTAIFDCCHSGSALDLPYMYTIDGNLQIHEQGTRAAARQFLSAGLDFLRGDSKKAKAGFKAAFEAFSTPQEDKSGPVTQERIKDRQTAADVILFSGCKDSQTSADANIDGNATGAMSYAFINTMKKVNNNITYKDLLGELRGFMLEEYTQVPCLSAGRPLDMNVKFAL